MNSKEKMTRALNHIAGPIPFDLGSLPTTGIHVSTMESLRSYYGLEKKTPKIIEVGQMLGMIEDDLREVMGIDTQPLWNPNTTYGFKSENWKEWETPWGQKVLVPGQFITRKVDGKTLIYAQGDSNYPAAAEMPESGYFFDNTNRQPSIDESKLDPQDNMEEFSLLSQEDICLLAKDKERLSNSEYALCGNVGSTYFGDIALIPGPMLKEPKGIRDVTEWYMSTVLRQDYIHEVFNKQLEIGLKNLEKAYDILGDSIQVAYICGTDFGTQNGPFCSVETFRELYAPYYRKINDWIHTHTNWKTFKHSCGAVEPFIPEFIDVGFDILNPVQWTATGMEAVKLKENYGKDITFWGGGVDTQRTLPFGSKEEVRKQVLEMCEIFSNDGGFVFNTIHNIQAETPIENIVAMVDAIKDFNNVSMI